MATNISAWDSHRSSDRLPELTPGVPLVQYFCDPGADVTSSKKISRGDELGTLIDNIHTPKLLVPAGWFQ